MKETYEKKEKERRKEGKKEGKKEREKERKQERKKAKKQERKPEKNHEIADKKKNAKRITFRQHLGLCISIQRETTPPFHGKSNIKERNKKLARSLTILERRIYREGNEKKE